MTLHRPANSRANRGHQTLTAQPAGSDGPAGFLSETSLTPCPANPKVCHNISDCRTTPSAMFAQLCWLCTGSSSPPARTVFFCLICFLMTVWCIFLCVCSLFNFCCSFCCCCVLLARRQRGHEVEQTPTSGSLTTPAAQWHKGVNMYSSPVNTSLLLWPACAQTRISRLWNSLKTWHWHI